MNSNFERFGSLAAMMTGILSIVYAVLFLFVSRANEYVGILGSWIVLGGTAFFAIAAYVALYQRLKERESGFALFALLLSGMAAFAMLQHGAFEAIEIYRAGAVSTALGAPSQVDPAGLATFGVVGVGAFLWGWLIVRTGSLPRTLGYVGILNAVLLVVLFFATIVGSQIIILISGGLTLVIVGPVWWIWVGRALANQKLVTSSERALAS
jgi:hypothetical protein